MSKRYISHLIGGVVFAGVWNVTSLLRGEGLRVSALIGGVAFALTGIWLDHVRRKKK